jgi:hypothetical protein
LNNSIYPSGVNILEIFITKLMLHFVSEKADEAHVVQRNSIEEGRKNRGFEAKDN